MEVYTGFTNSPNLSLCRDFFVETYYLAKVCSEDLLLQQPWQIQSCGTMRAQIDLGDSGAEKSEGTGATEKVEPIVLYMVNLLIGIITYSFQKLMVWVPLEICMTLEYAHKF